MATPPHSGAGEPDQSRPQAPAHGPGELAGRLKDAQARLHGMRHHPAVLEQQAQRAGNIQVRIADWITAFAGSMAFVYIHVVGFTIWMLFAEHKPWPTLTL